MMNVIRNISPFLIIIIASTTCFTEYSAQTQFDPTIVYKSIEDAQTALTYGKRVERLDLSRKKLTELPESIREFPDLRELNLNKNKLKELPEWLGEFEKLEVFSAERNQFTEFPLLILNWTNLRFLYLGDNLIPAIPIDIDLLKNLEWLGLWSNLIRIFPASMSDIPNLKTLDLLYNDMTFQEQTWLIELLPNVNIELSESCNCTFDD